MAAIQGGLDILQDLSKKICAAYHHAFKNTMKKGFRVGLVLIWIKWKREVLGFSLYMKIIKLSIILDTANAHPSPLGAGTPAQVSNTGIQVTVPGVC